MNITVEVTGLTLDSPICETGGYDPEGEVYSRPLTLRDAVVEEVARQALAKEKAEGWQPLSKLIGDVRAELIREQLLPVVTAAIDQPVQKTNHYGEPNGPAVSMREVLVDEARKVLQARVDSQGRPTQYHSDGKTDYVHHVIRELVREVFAVELKGVLDAAKEELRATLQQVAAAKLAESVPVR